MTIDNSMNIEWMPLKFSVVEYPKGDLFGKLLAITSLSPLGVLSGFVALIIFRRDLHTITLFTGLLVNSLFNSILKFLIAEPRPPSHSVEFLNGEYGMPSAHSQFMWFLSTYLFYFTFIRINYFKTDVITQFWKFLAVTVFLIIWASLVSFSRVYLRYHTTEQVLCGVVVGVVFASIWFLLTQNLFTAFFPIIASWKVSEILLIRDTTLIPNILWFEYISIVQEVRSRRRKSDSRKSQ